MKINLFMFLIFWYICVLLASALITIITRKGHIKNWFDCYCDFCGLPIHPKWLANVPLFSFYYLNGKTNCCNENLIYVFLLEFSVGNIICIILGTVLKYLMQ